MRRLITYFMMGLTTLGAVAQQGPLTLDQCRQMALANNARIRQADDAVGAARQTRREAFTKYFPEITAAGMAFKSNKDMVQVGILDLVTIGFLTSGYMGGIQFVQPLFMGGQIVNGNRLAEVGEAVAELQRRQSANDVLLTVDKYYWQIAALQAKTLTLRAAMATVDSLQQQVQAALDAGMVTLNDLLEVRLRRSEFQADSVDLANGIALSQMVLAQYVGADSTSVAIDFDPTTLNEVPQMPYDDYRDPAAALDDTPQYQLLLQNVRAAELRRKITIGKNLPSIAGGGGLFYQSIFNAKHAFGALMVTVSVPLSGWWGGSHAIKKARLEEASARTQLQNDAELLQLAMRQAWDNVTASQRKAQIASEAIGQAEENLSIYQAMYDAGTTTITDLLQAQALQRQCCDRFTEAYASYRVALTTYLIATAQS